MVLAGRTLHIYKHAHSLFVAAVVIVFISFFFIIHFEFKMVMDRSLCFLSSSSSFSSSSSLLANISKQEAEIYRVLTGCYCCYLISICIAYILNVNDGESDRDGNRIRIESVDLKLSHINFESVCASAYVCVKRIHNLKM